jgi:tRNA-dihydrouridine synthase C
MASIGGFDEAVTDFLRVPSNAHVESLARRYDAQETYPLPLAVQLMGSDPDLMAAMAEQMQKRKAPRIDLNCGCPSNTVTGRGAGSSLLKAPNVLYEVARALVKAVDTPVTLKMRSGYADTSLFEDNLLAAEASGVRYITLHPRTKEDGYGPPARWEYIARAKELLSIPVVGNGDIVSIDSALSMLATTRCDALMIGRGSVVDPFIFHKIRAHFHNNVYKPSWNQLCSYFEVYIAEMPSDMSIKVRVNKLKQLMSFQFKASPALLEKRQTVLSSQHKDVESFLSFALSLLKDDWLHLSGHTL